MVNVYAGPSLNQPLLNEYRDYGNEVKGIKRREMGYNLVSRNHQYLMRVLGETTKFQKHHRMGDMSIGKTKSERKKEISEPAGCPMHAK